VSEVIFLGSAKYQDIVDIHHDKVVQAFSEEIIRYCLKSTWGIGYPEWHHQELK
jgi:hypothetical protein